MNKKYQTLLNGYHINTKLRIAHFMAQLEHESNLKAISENLNYSAKRLLEIFPRHFTAETALKYQKQPQLIANKVYANRMGNGDENSGDGWKYRGRGFIQLTGKSNYLLLSKDTQIDFLENPELLLEEANAMISACWFWNKNKLNDLADKDDIVGITKVINGGLNGIDHRKKLLTKWKKLIK